MHLNTPNHNQTIIDSFTGEYRFLSNFWSVTVELDGEVYPSVEQAYKAAKTLDLQARNKIRDFLPNKKELQFQIEEVLSVVEVRPDWTDEMRLKVMEELLKQKFDGRFDQNGSNLQAKLLEIGDVQLVEGNTWGDTFFGVCEGVGENHLGKLLMKIRATAQVAVNGKR